jgi:NAD(P)-dependent dehydrogenase (short-subunit alcohol dehydrogenase family)
VNQLAAIITGAGGGIGRATAIELSGRGYRLVLCGRNAESLNETAAVAGGLVVTADVTKSGDMNRLVEKTVAEFGRIDAIVNNAGMAPSGDIDQITDEQWRGVIDTNLSAAFYLTRAAWPIFLRQGSGAVVNISSVAARDPFPGLTAYAAAKAGVNGFTFALAREGQKIGVRVYAIAPGAVETPMLRGLFSPQEVPVEVTLAPADVAKVVGQCVAGDLKFASGEVIWLHRAVD